MRMGLGLGFLRQKRASGGSPAPSFDAATEAWVAAVVLAGGTVSAPRKTLVDALIVGLKADGIWTKLDRLYVFAAENTKSALIDLVALAQATETSAPIFTVDVGYAVNGTNVVDFNYNPVTNGVHFTRDNAHCGAWNLVNRTSTAELISDVPTTSLMLYPKYSNDQIYTRVQDSWNGLAIGDPRGWIVGDRNNSADRDTYQNGALFGNVVTGGSTVVHNAPTELYSGGPCSAVSFGGSLTSIEHTALYNRLNTYMTALADPATTAWAAAVVSAGGTVSAPRKTLVDNLIVGLKADGVWTNLDRLYLFAAENTQSALIDLVTLAQATVNSAPAFTADQGYTTDGTKTVDFNYNPTTNAVHLSQDNCHVGVWNLFNGTSALQVITDIPGASFMIYPKFVDNNTYTRINDAGGGVAIGDPRGWIVGDRNNSANRDTYFNGSSLGNTTITSVALHNSATAQFVGGPCPAVSFGGSLTSGEHTAYYNRLRTYMTGIGIP